MGWGWGEETTEREAEKSSCERWKAKKATKPMREGRSGNEEEWVSAEYTAEKKALKKRKMAVEGMDCHIKNPKKRFLTTMSGGGGEAEGIVFYLLYDFCGIFGF